MGLGLRNDEGADVPRYVPKQHHALPKALDDATAAKLLRAAQAEKRMLVGVSVDLLLSTGLRVGEYTALSADAVVLIGDTHWLHVPVGKLHETATCNCTRESCTW